ncbi:MAG: hypothetical protein H7201_02320 [Candidatus Saccharibacteria bacterium]|nr:hypothetical protein [Microbacteriaceae bacterium]
MDQNMADSDNRDQTYGQYQRELALVDQILGLQAALAQEAVRNSPSRQRVEQLEHEINALRLSTAWRIGRLILLPVRLVRRFAGRFSS